MIAQVAQVTQVTDILSPEVATEIGLYIFILGGFLGYHLITRIPPLLHTPLMSATNAIAAISLVGSLVVAGSDYSQVHNGWICALLGFLAVTCSTTNAVGGFLITDRMLGMFRKSGEKRKTGGEKNRWLLLSGTAFFVFAIAVIIWWKGGPGFPVGNRSQKS